MSPVRRSAVAETSDLCGSSRKLAPIGTNPRRIRITAPQRCDSITTITRTARTSPSATARAIGSPSAASGAARKIPQSSRIIKTVRLGSLIRSCQAAIDLPASSTATERP
jgi:hypothetical protein